MFIVSNKSLNFRPHFRDVVRFVDMVTVGKHNVTGFLLTYRSIFDMAICGLLIECSSHGCFFHFVADVREVIVTFYSSSVNQIFIILAILR